MYYYARMTVGYRLITAKAVFSKIEKPANSPSRPRDGPQKAYCGVAVHPPTHALHSRKVESLMLSTGSHHHIRSAADGRSLASVILLREVRLVPTKAQQARLQEGAQVSHLSKGLPDSRPSALKSYTPRVRSLGRSRSALNSGTRPRRGR